VGSNGLQLLKKSQGKVEREREKSCEENGVRNVVYLLLKKKKLLRFFDISSQAVPLLLLLLVPFGISFCLAA
jgi:hypothetical protein